MTCDHHKNNANRVLAFISPVCRLSAALLIPALFLPSLAHAKCSHWDMTKNFDGHWYLLQDNGYGVNMTLKPASTGFRGTAVAHPPGRNPTDVEGSVSGGYTKTGVEFTIHWKNGTAGTYVGTFDDGGALRGTTRDKSNRSASWHSAKPYSAVCVGEEKERPPSKPKPDPVYWSGGTLGNAKQDTDRPGSTYYSFQPLKADGIECFQACTKSDECKSWTYIRPDLNYVRGRCDLKDAAPEPVLDFCCVSGLRGKVLGKPRPPSPIQYEKPKFKPKLKIDP